MTKSLTLSILFSTAVRAAVVAMLVILAISPLTSFILALRVVLVAKLVISVPNIFSSVFFILALYQSFLTTASFTASLSLLKSTRTGTNLSTYNLPALLFTLFKLVGTFFSLSISNLSTSDF